MGWKKAPSDLNETRNYKHRNIIGVPNTQCGQLHGPKLTQKWKSRILYCKEAL